MTTDRGAPALRHASRSRVKPYVGVAVAMLVVTSCSTQMLGTYLGNASRHNFNPASGITTANASTLVPRWTVTGGGNGSSAQPVVANGVAYWGDWAGREHATTLAGTDLWTSQLGTTQGCYPPSTGVSSSATVAKIDNRDVVLVGGGDATFYSLDAATGATLWSTRLGTSPEHFIWGSPGMWLDNVYIGVASYGGCPYVQGKLIQLDARTGAIKATFKVVPDGCIGGSVSSSPAIDAAAGVLYIGTGNNEFSCVEPLATSIVRLRLTDLSVVDKWQPPPGELTLDGDFLAAPTIFTATIAGQSRKLVGIPNKNGIFYGFNADDLAAGPLWRAQIAKAGVVANNGTAISPAAFDGTSLFVAGGATNNPDGTTCAGTLQKLDPATGARQWRNCLTGPVIGAVTAIPGIVITGVGKELHFDAMSDGHRLFTYAPGLGNFWATTTVSGSTVLAPNMNGNLIALGLP